MMVMQVVQQQIEGINGEIAKIDKRIEEIKAQIDQAAANRDGEQVRELTNGHEKMPFFGGGGGRLVIEVVGHSLSAKPWGQFDGVTT